MILTSANEKCVGKKADAYQWSSRQKAENYLKGVRNWKGIYAHLKFSVEEIEDYDHSEDPVSMQENKSKSSFDGVQLKRIEEMTDIMDFLRNLEDFTKKLEDRLMVMKKAEQQINGYHQDVLHVIEYYDNLNAAQGYKLYKLLHNIRVDRRKIKNEIAVIEQILNKQISYQNIYDMRQDVNNVMSQEYKARIDQTLFGNKKKVQVRSNEQTESTYIS